MNMDDIRSQYLTVNGIRLHYLWAGGSPSEALPPLILLHGNGGSGEVFRGAIAALEDRFTVYAPDSRCQGMSGGELSSLSYDAMADDTAAFAAALGLDGVSIAGWSDGGIIALIAASRRPAWLKRVIACGANLYPKGLKPSALRSMSADLAEAEASGDRYVAALSRMMLTSPDITPSDLRAINIPTLICAGENDLICRRHTQKIAASIPGSALKIFPGEDHGSYVCDPAKFAPLIAGSACKAGFTPSARG